MSRIIIRLLVLLFFEATMFAQPPDQKPLAFEVASIRSASDAGLCVARTIISPITTTGTIHDQIVV